jgi:ferredoxin/flavodoxin
MRTHKGLTAIYYFSGTGNTRFIAHRLDREFAAHSVPTRIQAIEDVVNVERLVLDSGVQMLGIGYPVHGFGPPRLAFDFVERLPRVGGTRVFIFMTAAAVFPLNRAASAGIAHRLAEKGYEVFHESLIRMPSNIISHTPVSQMITLCRRAETEAVRLVQAYKEGHPSRFRETLPVRLAARGVNALEHVGARLFGRDLSVSGACNRCGKCLQKCPTRNIVNRGGKIRFGWRCMACFRCVYACPQRAIMPRLERFAVLKAGYDMERLGISP